MSKNKANSSYILFLVVIAFFTALMHVWQRTQLIRVGYFLEKAKTNIREKENENRLLRIKMQHLRSLERVDSIAKEKFHMVSPPPDAIVYLSQEP